MKLELHGLTGAAVEVMQRAELSSKQFYQLFLKESNKIIFSVEFFLLFRGVFSGALLDLTSY